MRAAGAERVLTELLDKMSVFEGGRALLQEGRAWKDSPGVGSAGPGVPAASADCCSLGWRDRAASHISRRTRSSALQRQWSRSRPAQMWKNLYEMLKLESSRTYRCELTLE